MNPLDVLQIVTEKLERLGLPYMVAGSFASTIYGQPRYTQDADIVAGLSRLGIDDIVRSFSPDFYIDRGQVERAVESCTSFNIVHLESAFKVDLFVVGEGAFKQEALKRRARKTIKTEPHYAPYVQSPEDTILSKLDWYRQGGCVSDQQWRDVLGILKVQEGMLDFAYLQKWAQELQVVDLLNKALSDAGAQSVR
jgi:hypothetical protein